VDISVEKGDVSFPDFAALELVCEEAEGLGPAGQEDDPARLPVEAVDRMYSETGVAVDSIPEARVDLDPGLKKGAEIPLARLLNAQPGGLLYNEPAPARLKDQN
jgi:hypothetical protein